jgi:membrane protein involved in colicin uptake
VHTVPSDFSSQPVQTSTQAERLEHEAEAAEARVKDAAHKASKEFSKAEKDAKAKAKKAAGRIESNSDNPVFVGNAVAVVALSAGLGFGAYRKYASGDLSWKVVGAWTAVVGIFAMGDYYLSQWLFRKYPQKK